LNAAGNPKRTFSARSHRGDLLGGTQRASSLHPPVGWRLDSAQCGTICARKDGGEPSGKAS
jgi:hypothetical protein